MQIQPDMITLDPEVIGSLAPPSKLTYANSTSNSGKQKVHVEGDVPFRTLPRLERLKGLGTADETEPTRDDEEGSGDETGGEKSQKRIPKEKMKMRGKGKALKRYLKKKRKNVIEPSTVRNMSCGRTPSANKASLDCDTGEIGKAAGGAQAGTGKREAGSDWGAG